MRQAAVMLAALGLWACGDKAPKTDDKAAKPGSTASKAAAPKSAATPQTLVVYAGRSAKLVKPLIKEFEASTQIKVKVREGKSGALAALLLEEKAASPADVFWAQDAGSLGQVEKAGLFAMRPKGTEKVIDHFSSQSPRWVPTSGRARVLAYAPGKIAADALPKSVFELTDPKYKGQVGWAPTNASFQAFVTAMRVKHGDAKTEAWLKGMQANEAKKYPKNTPIIRALAAGEIQLGLPNHYYLLREKNKDPNYPVSQQFFADGDIGNLVNVAGIGVLKAGKNKEAAAKFVQFLLGKSAQTHFATKTFEYPVIAGIQQDKHLVPLDTLTKTAPQFELKRLEDLKTTRDLLRKVGLL
jgi:iron(III) transport system substrate-binding protein